MTQGFFSQEELEEKTRIDFDFNEGPNCQQCGLFRNCQSPKMKYTGEGQKGVLLVGEAGGRSEDQDWKRLGYKEPTQFIGDAGQLLRKELNILKLDLDRDFWKTNALSCRPSTQTGANRTPTKSELKLCKPLVDKTIRELNPKMIWLMGGSAVESLYMDRFSKLAINRWRKLCIPDRKTDAWIVPLFHPSYILRNKYDENLKATFKRDLRWAASCIKKERFTYTDESKEVVCLYEFDSILKLLKDILSEADNKHIQLFVDYETNCLKPQWPGSKIATISFCTGPTKPAFAFPYQYKDFFDRKQQAHIRMLWRKICRHQNISFLAQNIKFEDGWTRNIFDIQPYSWQWDTMLASHIEDNRSNYTGLKFQSYVKFGLEPYNKEMDQYLKAKTGHFNQVDKAPLDKLLLYNGLDTKMGMKLWQKQQEIFTLSPKLKSKHRLTEAYQLFHQGTLAFSDIQQNGICIDEEYYKKEDRKLTIKIKGLEKKLNESEEATLFYKHTNKTLDFGSTKDLGILFYKVLNLPAQRTSKDNYRVDVDALEGIKIPFVEDLLKLRKLEKIKGTDIAQLLREVCSGRIYPFIDLNIPVSYRSCIAKGTKILMPQYFKEYPNGVPIELVKEGDYVYCFDDELKPTIKKVKWAGKTGHRKVWRVHFHISSNRYSYLDCTPEHELRFIDGTYQSIADYCAYLTTVKKWGGDSKNNRVLSASRKYDMVCFTGHLRHGKGLLEHRLIYQNFIGELHSTEVVHHKNKNHLDHIPSNLEKMSLPEHSTLHCEDTVNSEKTRANNIKAVKKGWKEGRYINAVHIGEDHPSWLGLTKWGCLRALANKGGKIKLAVDAINVDFNTFKKYLDIHGIDWKIVKLRYDKNGKYISKKRLLELAPLGRAAIKDILGHNHYKLLQLYEYYGVDSTRRWGNQFSTGNHRIIKVEPINYEVDVYDIEVEDCHNFIANEICVHNSSSKPNFQNQQAHDPIASKLVRSGIFPSKGNKIAELDYSSIEVRVAALVTSDPNLLKYVTNPGADMHLDTAQDLWMLPEDEVTKEIRFHSKGCWVFRQFYGSFYKNCAIDLWKHIDCKTTSGITLKDHLQDQHIYNLNEYTEHCKDAEDIFWGVRFKKYAEWKEEINALYRKQGFIENLFGFRFVTSMSFNEISNYPIQSAAFLILLHSLILINETAKLEKWKTKIIGQIHDSILNDMYPKEQDHILKTSIYIMSEKMRELHKWITIPIPVEVELTEIDQPWITKKEVKI